MTMTHSEKSDIRQMKAWPYRKECKGHDPAKNLLCWWSLLFWQDVHKPTVSTFSAHIVILTSLAQTEEIQTHEVLQHVPHLFGLETGRRGKLSLVVKWICLATTDSPERDGAILEVPPGETPASQLIPKRITLFPKRRRQRRSPMSKNDEVQWANVRKKMVKEWVRLEWREKKTEDDEENVQEEERHGMGWHDMGPAWPAA